jgi:RNA exonuclease 1
MNVLCITLRGNQVVWCCVLPLAPIITDFRDLVLHIIADSPPPSWIRVQVSQSSPRMLFSIFNGSQNTHSIQKLVVLLIPGLISTILSLPPLPTSATSNPNLPIPIPLPSDPASTLSDSSDLPTSVDPHSEEAVILYGGIPFITRTFSHACPTRAPGDAIRMHSVLNTFLQTPVSGEGKKRRIQERISGSCFITVFLTRIVYLYRSGRHEEEEPGAVPLKCRANVRE